MKKVIIIGAGIGGLISAVKLKHHGYDVTIFEKNEHIGGKINQIKMNGFTFDMGPNITVYHEMFDEVFNYVGKDPNDYFEKVSLNNHYNVYFSKEDMAEVSSELVSLNRFLEKMDDNEISSYFHFLDKHYENSSRIEENSFKKSFKVVLDVIKSHVLANSSRKSISKSHNPSNSEFTLSKYLKAKILFQHLFLGGSPYDKASIKYINPKFSDLDDMKLIKGGMTEYINGLEKLMKEMNIKISTNTQVDEIFITQGQAKGVVIGEDIFCADIIINNTDFPYAMHNQIKNEKFRPRYTNKKLEKWNYSSSTFMIYLGLNIKLEHLNVDNLYLSSDLDENITSIYNTTLPTSPSMLLHVPSKIDLSLAPLNHESLIILVPVPNLKGFNQSWNDKLIHQFRQVVINRIASEDIIDNLEEHIVSEKIFTPKDWQNSVYSHYGAIFGPTPILRKSSQLRPEPKSKDIQRLYHTGSSVFPGASIPLVMVSAQLCVDEVLKYDPNGEGDACSIYAKNYENA